MLQATLSAMVAEDRREDADARRVEPRSGQSELLISEEFETRYAEPVPRNSPLLPPELVADLPEEVETVDLADELVTRAKRTGGIVLFIENPTWLAEVDGVAGLLRFTV